MTDRIKINEADLTLIEKNLIEYLNSDSSSFKGYNFKAGPLSGFIRVCKFVIRNLAFQLNKTVEEIFMDTALLEDSIYSLIKNFNYIPQLKTPAKKYLKMKFDIGSMGYTPQTNSTFKVFWNTGKYTSDYRFIPTFRDKWQDDYYTNVSVTDFQEQNMFYAYMTRYNNGGEDYLHSTMDVYQADWKYTEETIDIGTFEQLVELKNGSEYWADKMIPETIRVFVKETDTYWYEYKDIQLGYFDSNLRTYRKVFDKDNGISIQFGIDHLSRTLLDTETVRVFYAVTEGDEINDEQGDNEFTNESFYDVQIYEVKSDSSQTLVFSSSSSAGVAPFTVQPSGTDSYFTAELLDSSNTLTTFDNGVEKQSLESIKISAPLFRVTQGRGVSENDYNYLLSQKFTEYKGIKAWGGHREFYDIEDLQKEKMDLYLTKAGTVYSGTEAEMLQVINAVQSEQYKNGILTIDDVDIESIESGNKRRDLGFVYYTLFDDQFQFVGTALNRDEIVQYLDQYKILTIYFKYMNPIFTFIKPKITITLNPAYAKTFSLYDMKLNIYNWINSDVSFDRDLDLKELNSYLLSFDSINAVDSIQYTGKIKIKNVDTYADDLIYARTFTRFSGDLNNPIKAWRSGIYTTIATITTSGGSCSINGYTDDNFTSNIRKGLLRFKNYDGSNEFFTDSVFYIDDIEFSSFKLIGRRENVIGCESIDDIELTVE